MRYILGKTDYRTPGRRDCQAVIEWELTDDGRFSMSAEIWNPRHTDIYIGGQCVDAVAALFPRDKKAARMVEVWKRWHLNDMRAGCEHQRAEGWDKRPIDPTKPLDTYGKHFEGQLSDSWNMLAWVRPDEHPDGLLTKPCPVCGYHYGTGWLREQIPAEVIAEIRAW